MAYLRVHLSGGGEEGVLTQFILTYVYKMDKMKTFGIRRATQQRNYKYETVETSCDMKYETIITALNRPIYYYGKPAYQVSCNYY